MKEEINHDQEAKKLWEHVLEKVEALAPRDKDSVLWYMLLEMVPYWVRYASTYGRSEDYRYGKLVKKVTYMV